MKRINNIFFIAIISLMTLLSACSSDEPETQYTGPWTIEYSELYYGMHNTSDEFHAWFDKHNSSIIGAVFHKLSGTSWTIEGNEVYWSDYSEWYGGDIEWRETIQYATEDEMKAKVSEFEAFSIKDEKNRTYDDFKAGYKKNE